MAYNTGLATSGYGNAAWTPEAIRQGVQQIGNDPNTIYRKAMENGISGQQLDSAMGWNPGTANGYAQQQGYAPLSGSMGEQPFMANAAGASNPWIGQTSQPTVGVGSIAQQFNPISNPWLGQSTKGVQAGQSQAGTNAYAGSNPFLQQSIDAAMGDISRNFDLTTRPQLDAQMQASGSFGNTGVQQMQTEAQRNLAREMGNTAGQMRFQDYGLQAQLGESGANRQTQNNQFNIGNDLQGQIANSGYMAGDLGRNMTGYNSQAQFNAGQGQQAAMFDASNALGTQQFNANLGMGDLSRNANLAQGQGQFNAGQQNAAGQFNAGQGNQRYQFDQNLDFGIDTSNWNRMRTGQQDQVSLMDKVMNWNTQGLDWANTIQNAPWQYLNQGANVANSIAGQGGVQSQTQQGNPWLGAVGGAMAANQIYRPQGGGGSSYGGGSPYDGGYGFGTGSGYGFQDYGQFI